MATTPVTMPDPATLPLSSQKYMANGREPSPIVRDVVTVGNQIPRWAWALVAGFSTWKGWKAYKEWKGKKAGTSGG